jgi:hypothetical protein
MVRGYEYQVSMVDAARRDSLICLVVDVSRQISKSVTANIRVARRSPGAVYSPPESRAPSPRSLQCRVQPLILLSTLSGLPEGRRGLG